MAFIFTPAINAAYPAPNPSSVDPLDWYADFQSMDFADVSVPVGLTYIASIDRTAIGAGPLHLFSNAGDAVPGYWATSKTESSGLPAQGPLRVESGMVVLQVKNSDGSIKDVKTVTYASDSEGQIVGLYKSTTTGAAPISINVDAPAQDPGAVDPSEMYGDFQVMAYADVVVPAGLTYIGSIDRTAIGAGPLHMFSSTGDAVPSYWATSKTEASGQPAQGPLRVESGTVVLQVLGSDNVPVDVKTVAYAADTNGQIVGLYKSAAPVAAPISINVAAPAQDPGAVDPSEMYGDFQVMAYADVVVPAGLTYIGSIDRTAIGAGPLHMFSSTGDAVPSYWATSKTEASGQPAQGPLRVESGTVVLQVLGSDNVPVDVKTVAYAADTNGQIVGLYKSTTTGAAPISINVDAPAQDPGAVDPSEVYGDFQVMAYADVVVPAGLTYIGSIDRTAIGAGPLHMFSSTGDAVPSYWATSKTEASGQPAQGPLRVESGTVVLQVLGGDNVPVDVKTVAYAADTNAQIVGLYRGTTGSTGGQTVADGESALFEGVDGTVYAQFALPAQVTGVGETGSLKLVMYPDAHTIYVDAAKLNLSVDHHSVSFTIDTSSLPGDYQPYLLVAIFPDGLLTGVSGDQKFAWRVLRDSNVLWDVGDVLFLDRSGNDNWSGDGEANWYDGSTGNDTIDGGAGNDELRGGEGDDQIQGGAGDDTLRGDAGNDTLDGGDGHQDVANYGKYAKSEWELTREGTDFIMTHTATGERDVLRGIETIWFNSEGANLAPTMNHEAQNAWEMNGIRGSDYSDVIDADALHTASTVIQRDWIDPGAGDDYVDAGAGGDHILAGPGNDTMDGGDATYLARLTGTTEPWQLENRVEYSAKSKFYAIAKSVDADGAITGISGAVYYTVTDTRTDSPDGTDVVFNIDALQFSDKEVRLTPQVWVNKQWSSASNGEVTVGVNIDAGQFGDMAGAVPEDSQAQTAFGGSDRLNGGLGDDTLYGGASGDTLRGNKGNDTLDGGANTDATASSSQSWQPNGRDGVDVAEYAGQLARYSIKRVDDSHFTIADSKAGGDGTDWLVNIEVLRFSDVEVNLAVVGRANYAWSGAPDSMQATLTQYDWQGTEWNDTIDVSALELDLGMVWLDHVRDGAGDDVIVTGGGDDEITLGEGNDTVDGGAGRYDRISYDASSSRFKISREITGGQAVYTVVDKLPVEFGGLGRDQITNVESLNFTDTWMTLDVRVNAFGGSQNIIDGTNFGDVIDTALMVGQQPGADAVALVGGEPQVAQLTWPGLTLIEGAQYQLKLVQVYTYGPDQPVSITPLMRQNPHTGTQEEVTLTLTVKDGLLVGDYVLKDIAGFDLRVQLFELDSQGQTGATALDIQPLKLTMFRDVVVTGSGNDVVFAGAGGDQIQDAAGSDFYDGGADGHTGDTWQDQDQVSFAGARVRYVVETLKYTDLAIGGATKALIDERYPAIEDRPTSVVVVSDRLPADSGGQGVNTLINVERIQFADQSVDLGVRVTPWVSYDPQPGWIGSNQFDGGIQGDLIDASQYEAGGASADPNSPWWSDQDRLQGNDGNDTLIGGAGGDQLRGGRGDDVLDGGSNASFPVGQEAGVNEVYDIAEFGYSIARAVVTFYREAGAGEAGERFDDMGRAHASGTYVRSPFYDPTGFLVVQDRYTTAMGGEGRDVLRDMEVLSFSDAWERLDFNRNDSLQTRWLWDSAQQTNVEIQVMQRNAWGSRFGDLIQGLSDGENWLNGQAGDDALVGGDLRDVLEGGTGSDTLDGGGNPAVNPDTPWDTWAAYDVANFNADRAQFSIQKLVDDGSVTGVDQQIYYRVEHLIPGDLGGLGTDLVLNVERLQFKDSDLQLMPKVEQDNGWGQTRFTGSDFWDDIQGTSLQDWIEGQAGDDTIVAGSGNDEVRGGAGNDRVELGAGDDVAAEGSGNDSVWGGDGWDMVKFNDGVQRYSVEVRAKEGAGLLATLVPIDGLSGTAVSGGIVYSQALFFSDSRLGGAYDPATMYVQVTDHLQAAYGGDGVDQLVDVEALKFSNGTLYLGGSSLDSVSINAGDFVLNTVSQTPEMAWMNGVTSTDGTAGDDALTGTDSSSAGNAADWLRGWDGNDLLTGELGNDTLEGGRGMDTLVGGAHGGDFWDWNAGDVALYDTTPRARFDIQPWTNGGTLVVDLASVIGLSTSSFDPETGHLTQAALGVANAVVDFSLVSSKVGLGADVLTGVERVRFSDGEINLSVRDDSWTNTYTDSETQEQVQVVRHNFTGSFLPDLMVGTTNGDQFDGRGGDDTIDGGVEASDLPGNEWDKLDIVRYEGAKIRYQIDGVLVDIDNGYAVVDAADATGSEVFGLRITDLLPDSAGGSGTDLLVNVERVEFAASGTSGGDNSISIRPEVWYHDDWSVAVEPGQTRPQAMNVRGTDFSDALVGTDYGDWLSGGAGDDVLNGGKGGDDLEGGAGNDTLIGGANSAPDQWGWVRKDVARFNAPMSRFVIDSVDIGADQWMRVTDLLPSDDPASLGVDLLRGIESLSFNDRWVDVAVQTSTWTDWRGFHNVNQQGTVFGDEIVGGATDVDGVSMENRDFMRGGEGDDVLRGGGNGDEIEGGAGNDLIDGGANGTSGESWSDQDTVRFYGNASQYTVQKLTVSGGSRASAELHLGSTVMATLTDGVLAFTGPTLDADWVSLITKANAKFDWFDGSHAQAWLIADHLAADMGGEGVDLVFNAEQIQFRDGPLELEVRVDSSDWNLDGRVDWANVQGTSGRDVLTIDQLASLSQRLVSDLAQTRIDIDLRGGDDVYIGGSGGESIRTGAGNDYVDGADNSGVDPWGGLMRDEVRFEGRLSRYNLIDVTLSLDGAGHAVSLSTNVADLTVSGATITGASGKLATLVLADLNAAVTNMVTYAPDAATTVQGWLVADRLPAEFEGTGVDALVNIEALSFSDRWLPLEMQVWFNRAWQPEYDNVPWEQRPIVSAGVDGTLIADRIGYNANATQPVYDYSGDDNLRGNDGNDTIDGGAGGDWISGGQGDDWIDGGANGAVDEWGNTHIDQVQYDGEFDRYVITANADGSITVQDSDTEGDGTDTLWNVEALSFLDRYVRLGVETWVNRDPQTNKIWNVGLTGSMLNDTIDVSTLATPELQSARHWMDGADGDDSLSGGDGPDDLQGGTGDDTLDGGANGVDEWGNPGFDVAHYDGSESRYTLAFSADQGTTWGDSNPGGDDVWVQVTDSLTADEGGLGVDLLKGIEAIAFWDRFVMLKASRNVLDLDGDGKPDNAEVLGTDGADSLVGGTTNDRLDGAKGNDTLSGGAGGDLLRGGAGDDALDGGADGLDAGGRVLIDVAQFDGNMSGFTVTQTETGAFTVDDIDTSDGDEGTDSLTAIEGIQFADRFLSLKLEAHSSDTNGDGVLDQIEMRGLDLASSGDGLSADNQATGLSYRMMGGLGDDTLTGAELNDVFEGGAGADSIVGGDGHDRARYSGNFADYEVTQPGAVGGAFTVSHRNGGVDGADTLLSVEELVFADRVFQVLAADETASVITRDLDSDGNHKVDTRFSTGTDGDDLIAGPLDLINFMDAGTGNDTLVGGNLGDVFKPGAGNNAVDGGANLGLDAAGNPFVDQVLYEQDQADCTVSSVQSSRFTVSGGIEVGDSLSVALAGLTVTYKAVSTDLLAEVSAFAQKIQTAVDTADTVFTAKATATATSAIEVELVGEDMIFVVNASATNGSQPVDGSFSVNGANQSGSSLAVNSATNLAVGMSLSYSVTPSGSSDPVSYGPYKITAINSNTLTLNQTMGASPADSATLQVTAANPNGQPTVVSAITVDRWLEVTDGVSQNDVLRGIEQLVFRDGVLSLSPTQLVTSTWASTGIESVINITGTDLADLIKASSSNEVLSGGDGADYFIFKEGNGLDTIADFHGGNQGDVLALLLAAGDTDGMNGTGVDSIAELLTLGVQRGEDVLFDLGQGHSVTLTGVRLTDLTAANFDVMTAI